MIKYYGLAIHLLYNYDNYVTTKTQYRGLNVSTNELRVNSGTTSLKHIMHDFLVAMLCQYNRNITKVGSKLYQTSDKLFVDSGMADVHEISMMLSG